MSAAAAAPPQSLVEKVSNAITKLQEAAAPYMKYVEPAMQYGFIPAVIVLGLYTTKPRPTLGQFFFVG